MVTYPEDWKIDVVSTVADISTGCRDTQDNINNGRYPFYVRSPIVERIDVADYDCEAVLTAGDGVGTGKVFHYVNGKFAAHQRVYVINNFQNVDGKYFYYFFSKNFIKEVEKYTAKSSVDSVRKAMIADMEFPHPDLSEQKEIVKALSAFDTYINDLSELIEKKKAIRDGALEDLISGRTRLEGFDDTWTEAALGTIGYFIKGAPLSKANITQNGTPMILYGELYTTYKEVTYKTYRHTEAMVDSKYLSRIGDVIIPSSGETAEEIAVATCVMVSGVILAGDLNIYRTKEMDGRFLSFVINHVVNNNISEKAQGISIIHISAKELSKIVVRYPSLAEQSEIADIIDAMDEEIAALEADREKIMQIREGAMDDLLTGRVRLD